MEIADPVPKKKRLPPYVYDRAGRRIRVISTPYVVSLNEGQKRSQPSQTPSHPNGLLGPQAEKASTSTSCDRTGELPSNNGENIDIAGVETVMGRISLVSVDLSELPWTKERVDT